MAGRAPAALLLVRSLYPRAYKSGLYALGYISLAACATTPLTRSCLTPAQYKQIHDSEPPKVHGRLTGKADEDIRVIAGSALELRSWGETELSLLEICSREPPQAADGGGK